MVLLLRHLRPNILIKTRDLRKEVKWICPKIHLEFLWEMFLFLNPAVIECNGSFNRTFNRPVSQAWSLLAQLHYKLLPSVSLPVKVVCKRKSGPQGIFYRLKGHWLPFSHTFVSICLYILHRILMHNQVCEPLDKVILTYESVFYNMATQIHIPDLRL